MSNLCKTYAQELGQVLLALRNTITPQAGEVLVIGCSTSEIRGQAIGQDGSLEVARALYAVWADFFADTGLIPAFQCCEHLNRALVVPRSLCEHAHLTEVTAVPHASAGGSMATVAYELLEDAVLVEKIQADYGIDLGETVIGMHMKPVVIPLRMQPNHVGAARVLACKRRPPLIGGARARYDRN